MELVKNEGHDLNDETMLSWFYKALKRASKIPMQRFEAESGGGNLISDSAEMTRDEIKFHNFISRLRANFKELVVKPLKLQMLIEFPEMANDEVFNNQVDIIFYSNQVFEDWKKINTLAKRSEIVGTLLGVMNGEKPYFHIEWVMDNVFKLSPEEKAENQRYWAQDATAAAAAAAAGGAPTEGGEAAPAEGGEAAPVEGGEVQAGAQAAPEAPAGEEGGGEAPAEGGGEFEF
jgi:hypothetical protein